MAQHSRACLTGQGEHFQGILHIKPELDTKSETDKNAGMIDIYSKAINYYIGGGHYSMVKGRGGLSIFPFWSQLISSAVQNGGGGLNLISWQYYCCQCQFNSQLAFREIQISQNHHPIYNDL